MSTVRAVALLVVCTVAAGPAPAAVVINEILYHAPDDLDDLQFIELHNTGDAAVDLAGWKLTRGATFEFPRGTTIPANGYVVVCKDRGLFKKHYGFDALGPFQGALSHGNDRVDLIDTKGKSVDSVRYRSRAPWPLAADGYSASLERVCPTAPADVPENWAPSPLPAGAPKPGGTPGKPNANFADHLPPVIANVTVTPPHAAPGQGVRVEADVRSGDGLGAVELRYRVVGSRSESAESVVPMTKTPAGRYVATIPGHPADRIIRVRVHATDARGGQRDFPNANDLRPALSVYVHEPMQPGKIPWGFIINVGSAARGAAGYGAVAPAASPRGNSAFVYVDAKTGQPELFDFVSIPPRGGGYKVHFHKDHTLDGMTTINLIFEGEDRFVLAEPLAYEVYRKAGNAACRTDFVRTWVDGKPLGYQLLIEQPNKAFLKSHGLPTDGNMYKCVWFGSGVVGAHEKKTHVQEGHDDVVKLVEQLNKTKGDEQWAVIEKNFDVSQVVNYFAVNMLLSHWDGYFNNYFTYHDVHGGKWTMYPWDQDKTWGYHDGIRGYEVFTDMPLTFGMAGDKPPGWPRFLPVPPGFGFGAVWWRPPGHFSGPLLANPRFRELFLKRTRELVEKVYTEEVFFPLIKAMGERLEEEVQGRARARGEDPRRAVEHLRRNLDSLREHLTKRRQFLLAQDELKKAG
jgi:CotH kinase protein/Lamin Tail Domain